MPLGRPSGSTTQIDTFYENNHLVESFVRSKLEFVGFLYHNVKYFLLLVYSKIIIAS